MSHTDFLKWDNHVYCTPHRGSETIAQLDRHRRAGFDVVFLNLGDSNRPLDYIIRVAAYYRRWIQEHSSDFQFINTLDDIETAKTSQKLAIGFNVEGVYSIGDQLDIVQLYFDLGVRWILLVYNRANLAGFGVHDAEDCGLTPFGKTLIEEMDRVGIIKCLSHTGYRTAMDVLMSSAKPCIFSHSNPLGVHSHARNIPDELIRACADTGGVVGINGINLFLGEDDPCPKTLVRHIDYVAQLVGTDHVGLGLDYGYTDTRAVNDFINDQSYWPPGNSYEKAIRCVPPESLEEITLELERIGYGSKDLRKILGENMRRVSSSVWPGSTRMDEAL